MVTGGTGFVGGHSVRTLLDAGHTVRLLVRDGARITSNLGPLGVHVDDVVQGDMTDAGAVAEALDGCDAVLHCAAVVSLERRRAAEVVDTNPAGARTVIGAAAERNLDPIVYCSSVAALFRPGAPRLHGDLEPAKARNAYGRSKSRAEEVVRAFQADGVPVAI